MSLPDLKSLSIERHDNRGVVHITGHVNGVQVEVEKRSKGLSEPSFEGLRFPVYETVVSLDGRRIGDGADADDFFRRLERAVVARDERIDREAKGDTKNWLDTEDRRVDRELLDKVYGLK